MVSAVGGPCRSARLDAADRVDLEAVRLRTAAAARAACSSRSTGRPRRDSAGSFLTSVRSWLTPVAASNVRVVVVLHREVRVERAERERPPGRSARAIAGEHACVVAVRRHQAERSLAEADHGVELAVERRVARASRRSNVASGGAPSAARSTNGLADVDAVHGDAAPGELVGVATGPAADVEDPHPRPQPERADEEVDLLAVPLVNE